jgi:hypothetical protein
VSSLGNHVLSNHARRAKLNASDQVRKFVREKYVDSARRNGAATVTVRAGEIHKALHWDLKRVPQVCSALSTRKFLDFANVELVSRKGPPSGQSTTVEFTFRLLENDAPSDPSSSPRSAREKIADGSGLEALFGIFEEEFRALGGGEAFLNAQRASWGPDPWEKYEAEMQRGKKSTE